MATTVAIAGIGEMGAPLAARMSASGLRVITFAPRSEATRKRAVSARVEIVSDDQIAMADFFFSVVPSPAALPLAERFAEICVDTRKKPVYCDWNAISPALMTEISTRLAELGVSVIDGGIIGLAPKSTDGPGPVLYASGGEARRLNDLGRCGLNFSILDADIGAASALKLSYASITKGLIAIATASALAAETHGCQQALVDELAASQPALRTSFSKSVPNMLPKAGRWTSEMEQIASYMGGDTPSAQLYQAMSALYGVLAENTEARSLLGSFYEDRSEPVSGGIRDTGSTSI